MKSEIIHDITVDLLQKIDSGHIDIAEIYIDFVVKMHVFFEKLTDFSRLVGKYYFFVKLIHIISISL